MRSIEKNTIVKKEVLRCSETTYKLTYEHNELLKNERIYGKTNIKQHLEKIIRNEILIEKGFIGNKKDILKEKDLHKIQVKYLLDCRNESDKKKINKYNVANYYFNLAETFNRIAIHRKISRNELWKMIKKNTIIKDYNKTQKRIYKYIFRGELIPSPKTVERNLKDKDDLTSYLCIIYLNDNISYKLKEAYSLLIE